MNFGYDEHGRRLSSEDSGDDDTNDSQESYDSDCAGDSISSVDDEDRRGRQARGSARRRNHNGNEESDESDHDDGAVRKVPRRCDGEVTDNSTSDFSDDVELIIGEVAEQSIDEPLIDKRDVIAPAAHRHADDAHGKFLVEDRRVPSLMIGDGPASGSSARGFLDLVRGIPSRQRNLAITGHLHHGKTSLLTMLLGGRSYRQREDEVERKISVKSSVVTEIVSGAHYQHVSHLVTFVDTPGHPDFTSEMATALRLADAALFCVDAAEALTRNAVDILRRVVLQEGIPIVLVITKIDRLILELKLPPLDAYRKLRMIVDMVNNEIASFGDSRLPFMVSPLNGTVCFTSAKLGCFFTAETFALKYAQKYPTVNAAALSQQLWGQIAYEGGKFVHITNFRQRPTFVTLILEPLYKIIAHSVTGKGHFVLSSSLHPLPRSPITGAQEAVRHFCGDASAEGIEALLSVLPPTEARSIWLKEQYRLNVDDEDSVATIAPLMRSQNNGEENFAVVRVLCGILRAGTKVVAVDEHSSDVEPFYAFTIKEVLIRMLDGLVAVDSASAGQVVLITGFDMKAGSHLVLVGGAAAAPLLCEGESCSPGDAALTAWLDEVRVLPLKCGKPLAHIGIELKDPSKATQLHRGLQILVRTTPGLDAHKEETGEFTISGNGELHLDTAMHELRCGLCKGIKIGISQPFVSFSETVLEKDGVLALTASKWLQIGCTSGSVSRQLTERIEYEEVDLFPNGQDSVVKLWSTLRQFDVDALDARHIIAAGPHATKGPSLLIDDTLAEEQEQAALLTEQRLQAVAAGFRSAVSAGPLIGDVVRGVGVRLIFADIEPDAKDTAVVAAARTAVKQALLGAKPRLLEPVLAVDITCSSENVPKISEVLQMRRGSIVSEEPIAATTLVCVHGLVPAMDSFGLETQLRVTTLGEALPLFSFSCWDMVPGDPFDTTVHVAALQPARGYQLARDFTLKTRFRKGLPPLLAEFQV
ncbi:Elongation factor Tu GTP binding domain [Trypanosoma vivax]|uniref:Putative small nuclear ribonucleoprotein component-like protein n=1 Tax=Trypanosoma vivax (strain Y486) TaxID=1055687 RepID=G0U954_TRYVY|nr:putative small nuclear ribonucleoprotein component-like protein [Trypanosoma vivax]KAH8620156.1 Elongation factor Tu GTP binding domain [Trypanosoma vivax]CCC54138.1 putative small nuclear ribonucleoprotein component-like protein [Trypanosoma vivax Y486]